ncbi:hypothetical protein VI01_09780 [Pantoea sp. SM3]|nr:hypothetical protein VI01_09780 [Pantoea sp. SM3]
MMFVAKRIHFTKFHPSLSWLKSCEDDQDINRAAIGDVRFHCGTINSMHDRLARHAKPLADLCQRIKALVQKTQPG